MLKRVLFVVSLLFANASSGPLILNGVDTILTGKEYGFDFITQTACTTSTFSTGYDCNNHFWFFYLTSMEKYDLSSYRGYGFQAGKVNLDSLKIAPPNSTFDKMSLHIDSIPADSLSFYIGNSYYIKTGPDPRDQTIYYAKIRILNFRVLDSANRKVEMRFLWACNVTGPRRELETSGLDTFNLNTPLLSHGPSALRKTIRKSVFKVVGDRFVVPKELLGTGAYLTVYDLTGKKLGRVEVGDKEQVDLSRIQGSRGGVRVVRVEKNSMK